MKTFAVMMSLILSLGLASTAQADLLIEPYLEYEFSSTFELKTKGGSDVGGKTTGVVPGLRLGYKTPLMLWFALDYSMMSGGSHKENNDGGSGKMDRTNAYIDVGIDFPILLRGWVGYGVLNKAKYKDDNSGTDGTTFQGGSNFKIGLGFTGLPFVSVNLEHYMHSPSEYDTGSTTKSTSDTYSSAKESGTMLTVSIPFNL